MNTICINLKPKNNCQKKKRISILFMSILVFLYLKLYSHNIIYASAIVQKPACLMRPNLGFKINI